MADEADLQIDFVTSMQPVKFMEFSMVEPIQMPLLSRTGPILVNAPPLSKHAYQSGQRSHPGRSLD